MKPLPVTILDLVVLGVVLISALLAARARLHPRGARHRAPGSRPRPPPICSTRRSCPTLKPYIPNDTARARRLHRGRSSSVTLIVVSIITVRISDLDPRFARSARSTARWASCSAPARGLLLVRRRLRVLQLAGAARSSSPTGCRTPRLAPVLKETGRPADGDAAGRSRRLHRQVEEPQPQAGRPGEPPPRRRRPPSRPAPPARRRAEADRHGAARSRRRAALTERTRATRVTQPRPAVRSARRVEISLAGPYEAR